MTIQIRATKGKFQWNISRPSCGEMARYYDREGNGVPFAVWFALNKVPENREVQRTIIGTYVITTEWSGLDLDYELVPRVFHTRMFNSAAVGDPLESYYSWNYATLEEARQGHEEVVLFCRLRILTGQL